jgi:hypothetical protein
MATTKGEEKDLGDKKGDEVFNPYFKSVMTSSRMIFFESGIMHIEEKNTQRRWGNIMGRLEKLEDDVFRYVKVVDRSLDASSYES